MWTVLPCDIVWCISIISMQCESKLHKTKNALDVILENFIVKNHQTKKQLILIKVHMEMEDLKQWDWSWIQYN